MKYLRFALGLVWITGTNVAFGQDPDEVEISLGELTPMVMTLDPVLVSRFQADEGLEDEAERVRQLLKSKVEESFISVALEDISPFENYDAVIYLRSCPPSELVGCAYVIGARGGAEWVITGTVKRARGKGEIILDDEEEEESIDDSLAIAIHIVDVEDSRVALAFDASLTRDTEDYFATAVVEIVSKLVEGEGQIKDLRGKFDDPIVEAERKKLEAAILASSLGDLERELGGLVQRDTGRLEVPKLTQKDLDEYDTQDDIPPWELLNLEKKEYLRFKNSGKNLLEWRRMKKGRQGQILLVGAVQFGVAMHEQWFDGRWALDQSDLAPIEVDEWQAVRVGPSVGMDFALGYGFLPQFDVVFDVGFRAATFHYLFHKEVEGQPQEPKEPSGLSLSTFRLGASATYSPLPTWNIRPTITSGFTMWMGQPVDQIIDLNMAGPVEPLPAPTLFFVHAAPGGELTINDHLVFFARLKFSFLVAGNRVEEKHLLGEGFLSTTSEPIGGWAPGIEGEAGLQIRIGPFTKKRRMLE